MDGHVALVTGGAQNIGEAIARVFAAAGACVVIADLNGDKAAQTAARLTAETGSGVLGLGCDVTDAGNVDHVVAETVSAFGGISTLVNNVGWGRAYDDPLAVPPSPSRVSSPFSRAPPGMVPSRSGTLASA